jgi:hypothetical protein
VISALDSARPRRVLSVVFSAVILGLIAVSPVQAESFTDACGGPNNFDPAVCERVDYLVTEQDDTQRILSWTLGVLTFAITLPVWRGVFRG